MRKFSMPLCDGWTIRRNSRFIGDDADTRMAIGWRKVTATRTPTFWSSGNAGGVRSFMGCCPDRGLGVIAYINKASEIGIDDIGPKILRSWQ